MELGLRDARQCLWVTGTATMQTGAEGTTWVAPLDSESGEEEKRGLLAQRMEAKTSWSNRKASGPRKTLELSCFVTAFTRILVCSANSLLP